MERKSAKSAKKEQLTNSDSSDYYPTQVQNTGNSPYYVHLLANAMPDDEESDFDEDPFKDANTKRKTKGSNAIGHINGSDDDEDLPGKKRQRSKNSSNANGFENPFDKQTD